MYSPYPVFDVNEITTICNLVQDELERANEADFSTFGAYKAHKDYIADLLAVCTEYRDCILGY